MKPRECEVLLISLSLSYCPDKADSRGLGYEPGVSLWLCQCVQEPIDYNILSWMGSFKDAEIRLVPDC